VSTVAILYNPARLEARRLVDDTVPWLASQGHDAVVLRLPHTGAVATEDSPTGTVEGDGATGLHGVDLAVSVGGDGTYLHLVPKAYAADVAVLGVNFGHLGYLLEVEPESFREAVGRALSGDVRIEERTVLAVTVRGEIEHSPADDRSLLGENGRRWWVALNEVVVEKTVPGHMVHLTTAIDGESCFDYRADGVLVATPTGSTAYNLSAGGPILSPRLRAMIVTPVAPHLSIDRSLVLHPEQVVTVGIDGQRPAVVVVDGRQVGRLQPGSGVDCCVAPRPLRTVSLRGDGSDFAGHLRSTLSFERAVDQSGRRAVDQSGRRAVDQSGRGAVDIGNGPDPL